MTKEEKIDSVLGKGTTVNGDININGSTKIDGTVKGNVSVKDCLILGQDSTIKGSIRCKTAIIGGRIEGNINVKELVEFQSGANMLGDVICRGLIVQEGVFFEGNCKMSQKTEEKKTEGKQ
jgi:cytoskeletal protein CcmA (bactofilin family)